jgi:hypothetical protein
MSDWWVRTTLRIPLILLLTQMVVSLTASPSLEAGNSNCTAGSDQHAIETLTATRSGRLSTAIEISRRLACFQIPVPCCTSEEMSCLRSLKQTGLLQMSPFCLHTEHRLIKCLCFNSLKQEAFMNCMSQESFASLFHCREAGSIRIGRLAEDILNCSNNRSGGLVTQAGRQLRLTEVGR